LHAVSAKACWALLAVALRAGFPEGLASHGGEGATEDKMEDAPLSREILACGLPQKGNSD